MTHKYESVQLDAEAGGDFWDHHGHAGWIPMFKAAKDRGVGLHIDEYTDELKIRYDGTLPAGGQRIVRHNFTSAQADPTDQQ